MEICILFVCYFYILQISGKFITSNHNSIFTRFKSIFSCPRKTLHVQSDLYKALMSSCQHAYLITYVDMYKKKKINYITNNNNKR